MDPDFSVVTLERERGGEREGGGERGREGKKRKDQCLQNLDRKLVLTLGSMASTVIPRKLLKDMLQHNQGVKPIDRHGIQESRASAPTWRKSQDGDFARSRRANSPDWSKGIQHFGDREIELTDYLTCLRYGKITARCFTDLWEHLKSVMCYFASQ